MSRADLAQQDALDFACILRQPDGARVLAGLIDFCGVFESNEHGDLFREGMRNVGLMLYGRIRESPGGERAYIEARDECIRIFNKKEEGGNNDE
jgi:hypothetical protein